MRDKNNVKYVKLIGFSEDANMLINKAIRLAEKYKCERVEATHVFLTLVGSDKLSYDISELKKIEEKLLDEYVSMVNSGYFGRNIENIDITPDYFSRDLFILCSVASQEAFLRHENVTCDGLFSAIVDLICNTDAYTESNIIKLLSKFDITPENISEYIDFTEDFFIPEDIEEVIEDLNKADYIDNKIIKGVDNYVDELIEILSRKYKANPCLVGNAGVGKTSIVYRLVQRIKEGTVPDSLCDTHICYVNGATLTANTKYRGEFELRMQTLMKWASENNVILFLDEIHSFINAGKSGENSYDTAGNMIKKYLSDGSIKVIGATTYSEYHMAVEKDSAFKRRLQKLDIKEPSVTDTIAIVKNSLSEYTEYHSVDIKEDIIENMVSLCDRYMKEQYFPDKAYAVLDQSCARAKLQGKKEVTADIIFEIISKNTGIVLTKLKNNDKKSLLNLEEKISKNLIGQKNAVKAVCKAIRRSKSGVREENKPIASFLFVGPTGVGKTELCKVLSKEIGLSKESFIKIDMSEFSEKSSISKFIGSAPGYIGYGEGGQLTEKVKHNPYSLVLFDEIEKAHPEIFNSLLQLLDEGKLTDGQGQTVDFTNCIIVMTSNAGYGAETLGKKALGFASKEATKDYRECEKIALKELESTFRPELLNRIDNIVIFDKLDKEQCFSVVKLMLNKLSDRLYKEHNISVKFNTSLIEHIAEKGYSDKYGARNLRREIQDTVEDLLADNILSDKLTNGTKCTVSYTKNGMVLNIK